MNWNYLKISIKPLNTKSSNNTDSRFNFPTFNENNSQTNPNYKYETKDKNMTNQGMYLSNNRNVIWC